MGSDAGGEWASKIIQGNNFSVSINTDTKNEADRLFNGLSVGGMVMMPMNKTFWGDYFGMFGDKFGVNWTSQSTTLMGDYIASGASTWFGSAYNPLTLEKDWYFKNCLKFKDFLF